MKSWNFNIFPPTCQVRVVRFYVRSTPAAPQLQVLDRSGPPPGPNKPRIRVALAGPIAQLQARDRSGPPPDPNSKPRIRVVPAGNEQQALDQQRSLPDLNCKREIAVVPRRTRNSKLKIRVVPTGPDKQFSRIECRMECQNMCHIECQIGCQNRCQICQTEFQTMCQI